MSLRATAILGRRVMLGSILSLRRVRTPCLLLLLLLQRRLVLVAVEEAKVPMETGLTWVLELAC